MRGNSKDVAQGVHVDFVKEVSKVFDSRNEVKSDLAVISSITGLNPDQLAKKQQAKLDEILNKKASKADKGSGASR